MKNEVVTRFFQPTLWDGWLQSSAVMRNDSWNVALVACHVASKDDGSHPMDTAEEEDGSDEIDEGCSTAMDDIGILDYMHAATIFKHG